jgi:hypothetical protein
MSFADLKPRESEKAYEITLETQAAQAAIACRRV